jgi:phosphate-selective porin
MNPVSGAAGEIAAIVMAADRLRRNVLVTCPVSLKGNDCCYAGRVTPEGKIGAREAVGRQSNADFDDDPVLGASFDRSYPGLNWWATRYARIGVGWSDAWLNRFGGAGESDSLQTRFQQVC